MQAGDAVEMVLRWTEQRFDPQTGHSSRPVQSERAYPATVHYVRGRGDYQITLDLDAAQQRHWVEPNGALRKAYHGRREQWEGDVLVTRWLGAAFVRPREVAHAG